MWRVIANAKSCGDMHEPATFFPFPFIEYLSHFSVLGCLTAPYLFSVQLYYLLCNKLESVAPLDCSRDVVVSTELLNITYLPTYICDGGV
jgi:hypothetical protein